MADNVDITPGTGKTVATDDVGGFHYQRVKVTWGADGTATDASAAAPLPVTLATVTGISDSRKVVTTATTRVQLASLACKEVILTAETDNTGIVVVGGSTVVAALATRTGIPLSAGDSVSFAIDNTSDIYLDSTVSGDGVTYVVLT